jgi:hypothetical protein
LRVEDDTFSGFIRARDTVAVDTPASWATSFIVAMLNSPLFYSFVMLKQTALKTPFVIMLMAYKLWDTHLAFQ